MKRPNIEDYAKQDYGLPENYNDKGVYYSDDLEKYADWQEQRIKELEEKTERMKDDHHFQAFGRPRKQALKK